jgi:hypothetical protein
MGSSGLVWSNVHAANIYSTNITGTLQTASQPNILAGDSSKLGGVVAASYQTTAGLAANVALLTAADSPKLGGVVAASYQTTAGLAANVALLAAADSAKLGGVVAASFVQSSTLATSVTTGSLAVGANVTVSTSTLSVANTTGNVQINATLLKVANTTGTANLTPYDLKLGSTTVGNNQMSTNTFTIKGGASDWTITVATNSLIFAYGGINKMKLDTNGNLTVNGDITAFGAV